MSVVSFAKWSRERKRKERRRRLNFDFVASPFVLSARESAIYVERRYVKQREKERERER